MGLLRSLGGRKKAKALAPPQEKTASMIAEKILSVQRNTAAKLNAQAQKLGVVKTRILLGALLIGFAFYCAYLLVGAFI